MSELNPLGSILKGCPVCDSIVTITVPCECCGRKPSKFIAAIMKNKLPDDDRCETCGVNKARYETGLCSNCESIDYGDDPCNWPENIR